MNKISLCLLSGFVVLALANGDVLAAKKKPIHARSRGDFTAAERDKILEHAREVCVKRYGATSRVYKLDYHKWEVICTEPGR